MDFRDMLVYWKPILGGLVAVVVFAVTSTVGIIAWAESAIEDRVSLSEAKQALAHDYYFQESRISMKKLEIDEHQRELENLLDYIGDDEPTPRQAREIEYLDEEIIRLRSEIEDIEIAQADAHE